MVGQLVGGAVVVPVQTEVLMNAYQHGLILIGTAGDVSGVQVSQPKRIADHRYRRQTHCQRGDERIQQPSEHWIEDASSERDTQSVVAERE